MILVDSCWYIDRLRAGRDFRVELAPWARTGEALVCGPVRVEVLRGIVKKRVRDDAAAFFDLLREAPTDAALWESAWRLVWELDRRGHMLPVTDLAIAACALRSGAELVTRDTHFALVPDLRCRPDLP